MSRQAHNSWLLLAPPFPERGGAREIFLKHAERLSRAAEVAEADQDGIERALREALDMASQAERSTALRAALFLLTDLARQRWGIRVGDGPCVEVKRPVGARLDPLGEKARIRAQECLKRDEQLRHPATRAFVKEMETRRVHGGRFASIFALMREGRELAAALRRVRALPVGEQLRSLREAVDPYVQFVDETETCEHTGLRLQDIWRYFRHTWANQYTSTPGRSMAFLVRDRARDFHPVIGIASLGSPIVQIRERDAWIGWHPEAFLEVAAEEPSADLGVWLNKTVDTALEELFVEDFIEEQLLGPTELRRPTTATLERLLALGQDQRELHHRLASAQELKKAPKRGKGASNEAHWRERAQTHLYRSKRALSLADLLHSRMVLGRFLGDPPTQAEVANLLESPEGRRVIRRVLRKAKADRVGIAMADITVCGAIAPYGPILGGKLVSMLAAGPEVVAAYRRKYLDQESEIASSMAGRPIVRRSDLVFLGTTSLYGVGSSQYNRVRVPAELLGGRAGEWLQFLEIGKSEAYGTSHFSGDTVEALVALIRQSANGQRVNSIFGEGVSPKLRKIRDGLDALSLPADALLQHGRQRIVYAVPVIRNLREFLLGMDDEPRYLFDMRRPAQGTDAIAAWWSERWLRPRIARDEVLAAVEAHTLVRPVRHGARVSLPAVESGQGSLFDDLS